MICTLASSLTIYLPSPFLLASPNCRPRYSGQGHFSVFCRALRSAFVSASYLRNQFRETRVLGFLKPRDDADL